MNFLQMQQKIKNQNKSKHFDEKPLSIEELKDKIEKENKAHQEFLKKVNGM